MRSRALTITSSLRCRADEHDELHVNPDHLGWLCRTAGRAVTLAAPSPMPGLVKQALISAYSMLLRCTFAPISPTWTYAGQQPAHNHDILGVSTSSSLRDCHSQDDRWSGDPFPASLARDCIHPCHSIRSCERGAVALLQQFGHNTQGRSDTFDACMSFDIVI